MRKPMHPVLGEQYRCVWREEKSDDAINVLVEQVRRPDDYVMAMLFNSTVCYSL